jgi:hypothetical protein
VQLVPSLLKRAGCYKGSQLQGDDLTGLGTVEHGTFFGSFSNIAISQILKWRPIRSDTDANKFKSCDNAN